MSADPFSSYARGPDGPYSRAIELTPGEVPPTSAIHVNCDQGRLTAVLADDSDPITLILPGPGLYQLRIKQVISFTGAAAEDLFAAGQYSPALVGLY